MSDLLWPGDHRADGVLDDAAVLASMVRVEEVWLAALVAHDVAPAAAALPAGRLEGLLVGGDLDRVSRGAEASGNPVVGLVALLRERLGAAGEPTASRWLHRGLTSQDVLDTALVLGLREAVRRVLVELDRQVGAVARLAVEHRDTVMAGRTLTQHAVPTTFGLVASGWLGSLLDAREELDALGWPVQVGGAAGTLAGPVELAGAEGARRCVRTLTDELRLQPAFPWHTARRPLTRAADALVALTDAWGHLAGDVLLLARPEVGELTESSGGGSSTMPGKANPVRSLLLRRAALDAPARAATLHLAAADQVDQRAPGAWQVEWDALRALARHAVTAAGQATELVEGLEVHVEVMRARALEAAETLNAEQRSMRQVAGLPALDAVADPSAYLGLAGELVDAVVARSGHVPHPPPPPPPHQEVS